jgi:hypothetical protein
MWMRLRGLRKVELLEGPSRDFDDLAVLHVPAAFPRQVCNDPVGHINLYFLAQPVSLAICNVILFASMPTPTFETHRSDGNSSTIDSGNRNLARKPYT